MDRRRFVCGPLLLLTNDSPPCRDYFPRMVIDVSISPLSVWITNLTASPSTDQPDCADGCKQDRVQ